MPHHTEKECSYHLRQGMTSHQCVSSLKAMFPAALTDDEERRGVRQVQHGMEQKPKLRCIKQPLGAAALPLPPRERGTDSLYSNAHGDQHSSTVTLVPILKQGGVTIPQE